MHRGLTGCSLVALCLLATPAHAATRPGAGAPRGPATAAKSSLYYPPAPSPAPAGSTPEQAARHHLGRAHGVHDARLLFVHDTGRGGIIVGLRQTVGDLEVYHGDHKVLLDRDLRLRAIAGTPHSSLGARAHFTGAAARAAAVRAALHRLYGLDLAATPSSEPARAGYSYLDVAIPGPVDLALDRPARVKPVYFPHGGALVPAHYVEIQATVGREPDAHALVIDAAGQVLYRKDLIARESFSYRVFSDPSGRPLDGPLEDYNPHPASAPTDGPTKPVFPALIEMEGFNHNPDDQPDPWLAPGATETLGNNVDAYCDHLNPSGLGGDGEFRAKINGFNSFDYIYDISLEPLADQTQIMAAITSLFFVTNWHHDWWYDSGFNEAAGNAQVDNYGRGGVGGDVLLAEAQDAALEGARNNANMSTPADGESPRMQMYLWSSLVESVSFEADGASYPVGQAMFGPKKYDVTADLVLADDGSDAPSEACMPLVNDVAGKIVLADRGSCTFEVKATHAQNKGAVGVVFVDSLPDMDEFPPGGDAGVVDPTLPAVGISLANGQLLKDALAQGAVSGHLLGDSSVERDGTIDNGIVAHEWGHYIHHRLVNCGTLQCGGQSEGWGDFNAIMHSIREGDDLGATYALGYYGTFDTTGYRSLRRVAYTTDTDKNPLTFRHIGDENPLPVVVPYIEANGAPNSEVHNAGEVWATMMWEAFIALHEAHAGEPFEDIRRLMGDYIVSGMMMTAVDPDYNEQRDGILAAVHAADPQDFVTIAEAFARRGLGTCAVSPDKFSMSNAGAVEDFEVRPNGRLLAAAVDDSTQSCDGDGVVDHDEVGKLRLTVRNFGITAMSGATLTLSADSGSLVFPDGPEVAVPDLEPLSEAEIVVAVALGDSPPDIEDIKLTASLDTPNGCDTAATFVLPTVTNGDVQQNASATDDVDAPITPWKQGGTGEIWARAPGASGAVWHGIDSGSVSDAWLISPALDVSADAPLVVSFLHAYSFEATDGTFWDGGVIELSTDDGMTWTDISTWADPGYTGMLTNEVNPLFGRLAFSGQSQNFPSPTTLSLDLGMNFAGQSIKLRFRVASDAFVGAEGWFIDDIAFEGITNTPFSQWVPDQCGGSPDPTSSTGEVPTTGDVPTTDGDDDGFTVGESESDGSGGSSGDDGSPGLDDEGCGCNQSAPPAALPLLALLGLRRRRRSA